jgi:hypothetical protein
VRHARRDANHGEIVGYLQQCGWHVIDTADVGPNAPLLAGFPDLLAIIDGFTVGIEVKTADGTFTPDETMFWAEHKPWLRLEVVRNMDDVLLLTRRYGAGRL